MLEQSSWCDSAADEMNLLLILTSWAELMFSKSLIKVIQVWWRGSDGGRIHNFMPSALDSSQTRLVSSLFFFALIIKVIPVPAVCHFGLLTLFCIFVKSVGGYSIKETTTRWTRHLTPLQLSHAGIFTLLWLIRPLLSFELCWEINNVTKLYTHNVTGDFLTGYWETCQSAAVCCCTHTVLIRGAFLTQHRGFKWRFNTLYYFLRLTILLKHN